MSDGMEEVEPMEDAQEGGAVSMEHAAACHGYWSFHKAIALHITVPPAYFCVHASCGKYAGERQVVKETDIVKGCGTYKHFTKSRRHLTALAHALSHSFLT